MKTARLVATVATASLLFTIAPAHASAGLSSSGQPSVAPPPPTQSVELSDFESAVIDQTNQYRAAAGVGPVEADAILMANSRHWSTVMADTGKFVHSSRWNVAENIASHPNPGASAETIVNMWHNSPGHRANMLNQEYTRIGIGTAVSDSGQLYATQQLIW